MTSVVATDGQSGGGAATSRSLTARRIAELVKGELRGDGDVEVTGVAPIERAGPGSLTFLGVAKYAPFLAASGASVVLVTPALADADGSVAARVVVANPQEALLSLLPHLYVAAPRRPGIDATVRIGRGAVLGHEVEIGPYVVIGEGAVIGDRARIGASGVIGAGVTLAEDVQLFPHVTLYPGTSLGARVIIHAGARIGSDGFGYVFARGAHEKIPHVGRCLIESDVEIGANTTIDRGSIDDTVVGAGTKIDNLVQVAHNVRIGKRCLLMSQVGVSGSVRIGDGAIIAGQAGIQGHHSIGAGARIGGQAGVFGDVPAGETWSGYPARPHRESLRSSAALFKLSGMMKRLEKLLGNDE